MTIDAAAALNSTATTSDDARHAKLTHAAQQFEAVMLGELMKPLSNSAAIGGDDERGGTGTLKSFGVEAMAGAMARSGALGFAHRIVNSVEQHENKLSHPSEDSQKISKR